MLPARLLDAAWLSFLALAAAGVGFMHFRFGSAGPSSADVLDAIGNGGITSLRVAVLIVIATLIWVPVGVAVGLRPHLAERVQPVAQFLAAFPANLLFPVTAI